MPKGFPFVLGRPKVMGGGRDVATELEGYLGKTGECNSRMRITPHTPTTGYVVWGTENREGGGFGIVD